MLWTTITDNLVDRKLNLISYQQAMEKYERSKYRDMTNISALMKYSKYPEVTNEPNEWSDCDDTLSD